MTTIKGGCAITGLRKGSGGNVHYIKKRLWHARVSIDSIA